jgi:predicted HicB family RNase H-like nuclease
MAATRKQIVLRLKTDVNSSVRKAAKAQGLSINAYAEKVLGRASGKITSALKVTASK